MKSSDNQGVQFLEKRPLIRNNGNPIPIISCISSDEECDDIEILDSEILNFEHVLNETQIKKIQLFFLRPAY
jgi:hypothetical protein